METIKQPIIKVTYNHKNISSIISEDVISMRYVDMLDGGSDEIEITLADIDGKWQSNFYPEKKTRLEVEFGYDDNLLKCGVFYITGISASGLPDVVTIRGLATSPNQNVRTIKTQTHRNKTLRQLAESVAQEHGWQIIGNIANMQIYKVTQKEQTDLAFLARIAREFGYVFSVRDNKMIFESLYNLATKGSVRVYDKSDLIDYSWDDAMIQQYKSVQVIYHSAKDNKTVKKEADKDSKLPNGQDAGGVNKNTSNDTLVVYVRAENEEQAQAKANAILFKNNTQGQTGTFNFYGDYLLVCGSNIDLHGFGVLSGTWLIKQSTHIFDRTKGYTTSIDALRLKDVARPEYRTPKKRKPRPKVKVLPPRPAGGGGGGGGISYDAAMI